MLWLRAIGTIAMIFIIFEGVARLSPYYIQPQVHQKFQVSKGPARPEAYQEEAKFNTWEWRTNGRGARGALYQGQKIQVGFFGTSTTACSFLTQKHSWPERIANKYNELHADNYGRDGAGSYEARTIMNDLADKGVRYDAVVVMTRPSLPYELKADADSTAFHFWKRWGEPRRGIQFTELLKRQAPFFQATGSGFTQWYEWLSLPFAFAAPKYQERNPANRKIIAEGKIRFADDPENFRLSEIEYRFIPKETKRLLTAARRLSERVIFLAEAVAYDELQKPGVGERWYLLNPIKDKPGYYRSMRSNAFIRRARMQEMMKVARKMPVDTLDLDFHMRILLRNHDDLFYDHNHYTAQGAAEVARYVGAHLEKVLNLKPEPSKMIARYRTK